MTETMQLTDIGITPRKASQFAAKGICTVQDLLMFYPTKYLDFRNPISLADGKQYAGQHVAVRGQVVSTRVINGKHFMLRLSDGNNFCSVFWFNQSYRARQFSVGQMRYRKLERRVQEPDDIGTGFRVVRFTDSVLHQADIPENQGHVGRISSGCDCTGITLYP